MKRSRKQTNFQLIDVHDHFVSICLHDLNDHEYGDEITSRLPLKIFSTLIKNLEEKDGQTQLLCYVSLIRACNKIL